MTTKRIIQIDASALKHSHCLLKFYRTVVEGWRGCGLSNDIAYGVAVHRCIETFTATEGDQVEAMNAAHSYWRELEASGQLQIKEKKGYLNILHLTTTCNRWFNSVGSMMFDATSQWQVLKSSKDNKPISEIKFRVPYLSTDTVDILLAGTIDCLLLHKDSKQLIVRDYKTTSVWDSESYLSGYSLSLQLMFYVIALRRFAACNPTSEIATILSSQPTIGCQIQAIFLKSKPDADSEIVNSKIHVYSEEKLREFEDCFDGAVKALVIWLERNQEPPRQGVANDTCDSKFGRCHFFGTCQLDDEQERQRMLRQFFTQRPYDPLQHGELIKK